MQSVSPPRWVLGIEAVLEALGRTVAWLGLAMVVVMALVVVLRYWVGVGSIALQEAVAYMHAALFMLGAGYTLKHDGHVRVDVLYRGWSSRGQAMVDLAGTVFLLFPFCIFVAWVSFDYVASSVRVLEGSSEAGGLPGVFVLKALIPVMAVTVLLAGAARVGRAVHVIRSQP
ncbi:MAG: TRAP transporter small permease subunit [Myxococcota bacterium]